LLDDPADHVIARESDGRDCFNYSYCPSTTEQVVANVLSVGGMFPLSICPAAKKLYKKVT